MCGYIFYYRNCPGFYHFLFGKAVFLNAILFLFHLLYYFHF
jgi:hypothetical protein